MLESIDPPLVVGSSPYGGYDFVLSDQNRTPAVGVSLLDPRLPTMFLRERCSAFQIALGGRPTDISKGNVIFSIMFGN
jgi:hypothetical protein